MHNGVEQSTKVGLSARGPAHTHPPDGEHGRVVVQVQEADVAVLLGQHEEDLFEMRIQNKTK